MMTNVNAGDLNNKLFTVLLIKSFAMERPANRQVVTDVSEEISASIFRDCVILSYQAFLKINL
jgi:hypothetical protein